MKTVAEVIGVSRSNLTERLQERPQSRIGRPPLPDAELVAQIKVLIGELPTYGYRRVHAILKRQALAAGLKPANHKRVYRVMKAHGLLLDRHAGGIERRHDGRIAVDERNRRWCSDSFEIGCDNGETKIWREVEAGNEWIVDADLKDYFGSVDHEKLMTLIGKQIADSRVLILIQQMLKAGYKDKGRLYETPRGTPQGGVVSPLLSNILLTPFDKEMRHKGYQLTRWAVIIAAGEAYTIAHGRAFLWSEQGYQAARQICRADGLLTPPSTLLAIRAGYRPVLHPDIEENPHFC